MAKAEVTVHVADFDEVKRYVEQLEDAVVTLWDWLPEEDAHQLSGAMPRLAGFLAELDHRIAHEQPVVRHNVWAESDA